jgi:outer membrane protein, heavy metal efflux system
VSALADTAPPFADVFRQAERASPRLLEVAAGVEAAEGHARQAKAWPAPVVGIEREDFNGSGLYHGSALAQTTLSISEPLEIGGHRKARIEASRANVSAAQARRAQARVELGYDLALAYAAAEAAGARSDLLTQDLDRAREDVRSARALVDAGKEGELRAVQAEAAASAAKAELEAAKADAVGALARLSALVGSRDPFDRVQPSLLRAAARRAVTTTDIPVAPEVLTAEAQRTTAERRVLVEQKRAIPIPSFTLGRRHLAGVDEDVWVAGISIPLPIFDRNRGDIAAARAELRAAEARLDAARLDADAEGRAARAEAAAIEARLTASTQAEQSANEAYRLARVGYEAGRTPLFELQGTRRALTEAQLRSLDARVANVRAQATLDRLAGRVPFIE